MPSMSMTRQGKHCEFWQDPQGHVCTPAGFQERYWDSAAGYCFCKGLTAACRLDMSLLHALSWALGTGQ